MAFCDEDPIERVFLADVARRGLGRFAALRDGDRLQRSAISAPTSSPPGRARRHSPRRPRAPGRGCSIGEEGAVSELWEAARGNLPPVREDRPGQPVYITRGSAATGRERSPSRAARTIWSCS